MGKLKKLVDHHNRCLKLIWAREAMHALWFPACVILLALAEHLLSLREVCSPAPLPEPSTFAEEYKRSKTFDDWASKSLQQAHSESGLTALRFKSIADLGPAYTRKYRDCVRQRHNSKCK